MTRQEVKPNKEAISSDTPTRTEWQYFDENCNPVHLSKVVHKNQPLIVVYPYSHSREKGITRKKVHTVELKGWAEIGDVPTPLRVGDTVKLSVGTTKQLMSFLYKAFPEIEKLVVDKNGKTRITKKTITFNYQDLETILKTIGKENRTYEVRRKTSIANSLASLTSKVQSRKTKLAKGGLVHFLSLYSDDIALSDGDIQAILSLLSLVPAANVSVTENFLQTKDRINVAYLDDVIGRFEELSRIQSDNEKDWQMFFEDHGWILANLFPFQVILRDREAYVGGKTIENKEGRVVDFLFQNGFRDNYALLEIKTHTKALLKITPYRKPDAYAVHDDLSGAISQCLDQKHTFQTEMGQKYKILDPKVVLVCGTKSSLSDSQVACFELVRANQKHVDIVTFDELLQKIRGLRDVFQS